MSIPITLSWARNEGCYQLLGLGARELGAIVLCEGGMTFLRIADGASDPILAQVQKRRSGDALYGI